MSAPLPPHKRAANAVHDHFVQKMDARTRQLFAGARADLWHGPFSADDMEAEGIPAWPGYMSAIRALEAWWSEEGGPVYYDAGCGEVCEGEPEEWDDELNQPAYLEETWAFDRSDAKRALFGELIGNGM